MNNPQVKVIVQNRRAHHDYIIEDSYECGIVLKGTEIKSIRSGKVNLHDAYCMVKNGEMLIYNMHISPYEKGNIFNHVPNQTRKLLLHKREIVRLSSKVQKDGYTLIPLSLYLVGGLAKIKLGLAKGKKLHDKRETLKEKAMDQEIKKQINPKYQG